MTWWRRQRRSEATHPPATPSTTSTQLALTPLNDRVVVRPTPRDEVTRSGIVLPDTAREKPQRGEVRLDGRTALHLRVSGAPGQTVAGVHRYELWLDTTTRFPLKVVSRDQTDAVIETVVMDDLEIDAPLAESLFDPGSE